MPSKLLSGTNDLPKSFHNDRTTRNPHAYERYTGGSSSGPAAIVASGLCSAALGTDGGGWKKSNTQASNDSHYCSRIKIVTIIL